MPQGSPYPSNNKATDIETARINRDFTRENNNALLFNAPPERVFNDATEYIRPLRRAWELSELGVNPGMVDGIAKQYGDIALREASRPDGSSGFDMGLANQQMPARQALFAQMQADQGNLISGAQGDAAGGQLLSSALGAGPGRGGQLQAQRSAEGMVGDVGRAAGQESAARSQNLAQEAAAQRAIGMQIAQANVQALLRQKEQDNQARMTFGGLANQGAQAREDALNMMFRWVYGGGVSNLQPMANAISQLGTNTMAGIGTAGGTAQAVGLGVPSTPQNPGPPPPMPEVPWNNPFGGY